MPPWLPIARSYLGVIETPGPGTTPIIGQWLKRLKAWWTGDDVPWCGVFAADCVTEAGLEPPKQWYRAKAWASWGVPLTAPCLGCIVVFERQGGGHVGFVVGRDPRGRLMVLGGNQGDKVSIVPFDPTRVIALRWPAGDFERLPLPVIQTSAASSSQEA